jgi:Fic family protein
MKMYENLSEKLQEILNSEYRTKEKLKYLIPRNYDRNAIWDEIQAARRSECETVDLKDVEGESFWFNITDRMIESIKVLEIDGKRDIKKHATKEIMKDVIKESLIDEALSSSAIEGVFSTRERVQMLVESDENPKDETDQMLLNNFNVLNYVIENKDKELSHHIIKEMWEILTENTVERDGIGEIYRAGPVYVVDTVRNETKHTAPDHTEVYDMMEDLIRFFNSYDDIPIVIRASIIHFYFVYVHPFPDGNGRTARALTMMYLIQNEYEFFAGVSISSMLSEKRNQYYKAIENSEIHSGDITYFVEFYSDLLVKTIEVMADKYLQVALKKLIVPYSEEHDDILNSRQIDAFNYIIEKDDSSYITIEKYMSKYGVKRETARTDLDKLESLGFLELKVVKKVKKFKSKGLYKIAQILTEGEEE